jgi:hypothetical protein
LILKKRYFCHSFFISSPVVTPLEGRRGDGGRHTVPDEEEETTIKGEIFIELPNTRTT